MNSLLLDIAFTHLRHRKRQTLVSLVGVALGVGFFIGMASMMQGFQRYFVTKIIDVSPHIVIKDEYREPPVQPVERRYADGAIDLRGVTPREEVRGIRHSEGILSNLRNRPGLHVAPTLRGQIILRYGNQDVTASLYGIVPEQERLVTNLEKDLVAGSLTALLTTPNGVLLGEGLAYKLGATMGDSLSVISPAGVVMMMKVVGIFRTGITGMDNTECYALLKKSQILQARLNVVNQIRIRLSEIDQAEPLARSLEQRYGYRTESWEESNRNVLGIFVIQNGIMYSSVGAILLVAAFGIFNIISTVIYEKLRDIAILRSMGFTASDIRWIFLAEGWLVGILGALIGWGLGFGLVKLLGMIHFKVEGFVKTQGFILYHTPWHYLLGAAFAIIAAGLAGWLPARKAGGIDPVDIIRGAT